MKNLSFQIQTAMKQLLKDFAILAKRLNAIEQATQIGQENVWITVKMRLMQIQQIVEAIPERHRLLRQQQVDNLSDLIRTVLELEIGNDKRKHFLTVFKNFMENQIAETAEKVEPYCKEIYNLLLQYTDIQELWYQIVTFEIPFTDDFAAQNGWSEAYLQQVTLEYKRFCFLYAVTNRAVYPCQDVEIIWKSHLTYSYSYWTEFANILKKRFHHYPTRNNAEAIRKYKHFYNDTLELYAYFFNETVPNDIWKSAEERFVEKSYHKIDTMQNIILSKNQFSKLKLAFVALLGLEILFAFLPIALPSLAILATKVLPFIWAIGSLQWFSVRIPISVKIRLPKVRPNAASQPTQNERVVTPNGYQYAVKRENMPALAES